MAKTRAELDQQRARLAERIQTQRVNLARELAPLQGIAQVGNTVSTLLHEAIAYVRQSPLAIPVLVGSLLLLKPRGVLRWVKRGFFIWRGWRTVQQWQTGTVLGLLRRVLAAKSFFTTK